MQLAVAEPLLCTVSPHEGWPIIPVHLAVTVPLFRPVSLHNGRPILPVPFTVSIPHLRPVSFDDGRPVFAVSLTISAPLLHPVTAYDSWSVLAVQLTVLIPRLRPVSLYDGRPEIPVGLPLGISPDHALWVGTIRNPGLGGKELDQVATSHCAGLTTPLVRVPDLSNAMNDDAQREIAAIDARLADLRAEFDRLDSTGQPTFAVQQELSALEARRAALQKKATRKPSSDERAAKRFKDMRDHVAKVRPFGEGSRARQLLRNLKPQLDQQHADTLDFANTRGNPFRARFFPPQDPQAPDWLRRVPTVYFYRRYRDGSGDGQLIGTYYVHSLLGRTEGLSLWNNDPEAQIDAETMNSIREWLKPKFPDWQAAVERDDAEFGIRTRPESMNPARRVASYLLEEADPAAVVAAPAPAEDDGDEEGAEPQVAIDPIAKEDMAEVRRGIEMAFGHYGDWVWDYTLEKTDWNASFKLEVDGRLAGFYCLAFRDINEEVAAENYTPLEDLSRYSSKRGLEGVALFLFPEFRKFGYGSLMKNAVRSLGADYLWGIQLKSLKNLKEWLHRRRLVAENEEAYLTLEDLR